MPKITVTLPDGSKKQVEKGTTPKQVAASIGERLAMASLAAKVDGELVDVTKPLEKSCKLQLITFKDPEGVEVFRHSTAHIFAFAVQELYPNAKNTIGPPVDEGFYYDFDDLNIKMEDFPKIEKKMQELVDKDLPCTRTELTLAQVKKLFPKNKYKVEMASDFKTQGSKLSAYKIGDKFIDLCRGPHVPSTGYIKAFKLTKLAGAYWRADAKNKMLTRVYGISFPDKKQLKKHFELLEEAEKRDHRKLGKQLDLWTFNELAPGCPFFHAKGTVILNEMLSFLRGEYRKRGYQEVFTPQLFHKSLWEQSGHWQHYKENMFIVDVEKQQHALKAMNCPCHMLLYKTKKHSYRELPLRLADFGNLHRNELSGTLTGMFRVRKFSQDDSHVFITPDQIEEEIGKQLEFVKYVYKEVFNFDYHVELSTRPEKAMGSKILWENAEKALESALKKHKLDYKINPGDGAFYGPKIDYHVKDALGRTWQCGTVQLDFQMPESFDITYEGEDGKSHRAVVIHRAILGSLERFIGVLTEHYAGKFPLWLNPNQVKILTVVNRVDKHAEKVFKKMFDAGVRAETDFRPETLNKKIREAQLEQFNYILVMGEKEAKQGTVTVRTRDNKVHGEMKVDAFIKKVQEEICKRK